MKKTFMRTELKRAILEPTEDLDDICIVPEMRPHHIKNASINVHEDGYAFVSWLQPVNDWRYCLYLGLILLSIIALIVVLMSLFWDECFLGLGLI